MAKKEKVVLTTVRSTDDFKAAYRAKRRLVERELEDFRFALGEQWSEDDTTKLKAAGVKVFTDNRIAPNLFLLTGLERQNRSDFKAFPEGEEDGVKAEIASALFKDAIKKSGYAYKSSEQFKDGITCGESHLELYLDYSESLINGKPLWQKCDGDCVFPDPASREYDFSDARYVYKLKKAVSIDDLISMYPEKQKKIEAAGSGRFDVSAIIGGETHRQPRDYPSNGQDSTADEDSRDQTFDLLERYYKKYVPKIFLGDKKTGDIEEVDDVESAQTFIEEYKAGIARDQQAYQETVAQKVAAVGVQSGMVGFSIDPQAQQMAMAGLQQAGQLPPAPPPQDPERFVVLKKRVPEIWCFTHVPGIEEPLADERAWFYPKWKSYPFVPYFARFSTAPLKGDERHLLVQGLVHGVKGAQEKHNKAEMLMLRHLNASTNSGWLTEENTWVDPEAVKNFGTAPGVNLEYKQGRPQPQRIQAMPLSTAHAQVSVDSAGSIKEQLGINADLLATQQGGADSGRAIALRQKQGLLMVQELFDNLSRSRQIAGKLLLSQLGEIYDTETAARVLGEAFMRKMFPAPTLLDPQTGQPTPMQGADGKPMQYDRDMAEVAIAEVLNGKLGDYDVAVGESVASETQRMANSMELDSLAQRYPGLIPPEILIRHSQLPESAKAEITQAVQQAQQQQAQMQQQALAAQSAGGNLRRAPGAKGGANG